MSLRISGVVLMTTLLLPTVCRAQAKIELKNGQTLTVQTILEANWKTLTYRIAGTKQSLPAKEVKDFRFTGKAIQSGLNHYRSREFDRALKVFKKLGKTANLEEKAFLSYYSAQALFQLHNFSKAKTACSSFLETHPNHFYAPIVHFSLGACFERAGQFDVARQKYRRTQKYGEQWISKANFSIGNSYLSESIHKGKPLIAKSAIPIFKALKEMKDYEDTATLSLIRVYIRIEQLKNAESLLTSLEEKTLISAETRALFHFTKGEFFESQKLSKAALFHYLRILLLHGSTKHSGQAQEAAVRLSVALRLKNVAQRCQYYRRKPSFKTPLREEAFVAAIFQNISADLALEKLKESLKNATGKEKLGLLFLQCRILSTLNKTDEYKQIVELLKKEYPEEFSKRNMDVAFLIENLNKLKKEWTRSKKQPERNSIQSKLTSALKNLKIVLRKKNAAVEKIEASIEKPKDQFRPDVIAAKRARNSCDFNYGSGLYFLALTYKVNSEDRTKLLKEAERAVDNFTSQCDNVSMELLGRAYNLFGMILLEQGKIDRALEEFDAIKEYRIGFSAQFRAKNPDFAKELKKLEETTWINAYRYYAKACIRKDALPLAIKELYLLKAALPNNLHYVEGLLAHFELCEYLASAGRVTEALEELDPILNRPGTVHVANLSKETLKNEARKALASVSDAAQGAIFPPELQFQAGLGYQIRGDDEAAIIGYKGVLTSAVTKDERALWVPKACREMARLLYHQERYIEAALAFCILANEFPTHPEAPTALKRAKKALSKAIESHREEDRAGPIHNVQKKIERILVNRGDNDTKITILLKRAGVLEAKKNYLKAAKEYLLVPEFVTNKEKKTAPCQHYAIALARAGYCYSRHWQSANSFQYYERALELLEQARQVAQNRHDQRAYVSASYYLSQLANFKKDYKKALEYLKHFEPSLTNSNPLGPRLIAQKLTAYIGLRQFSSAEESYKLVSQNSDPTVTAMALDLADAFTRAAVIEEKKSNSAKIKVQSYRAKAADYASDWISRSKKLQRSSLFWAASLIMDGQRYAKAVGVYERLLKEFPRPEINGKLLGKKARAESALHDQYDLAKMNLARAYLIAGKAKEAAKLFTELKALVVLKKKNTLIARGSFVKQASETLRDDKGRPVRCRVYSIKEKGEDVTYFVPPRQSSSQVLKGKDASQSYGKRDLLIFRQRFRSNLMVLSGLAEALWLQYRRSGDKNDLVNSVQKAWNNYYSLISRLDESVYEDLRDLYRLPERRYTDARMSVALRLLEIAYERGDYKHILTSVANFEDSGWLTACSAALQSKFKALQKRALSKK